MRHEMNETRPDHPGPGGGRQPDELINNRVTRARQLILTGHTRQQICEILSEEWDLHPRSIYDYINKAKAQIAEEFKSEETFEDKRNEFIASLQNSLKDAIKENDRKATVQLYKLLSEIQGYVTQKIDVTSAGEKITKIEISINGQSQREDS